MFLKTLSPVFKNIVSEDDPEMYADQPMHIMLYQTMKNV
jgi:hypothetical protein